MPEALLKVSGLSTHFETREGLVRAVDGVDFEIKKGTILGLVGESGCGKSMTALSIMRLIQPPGKIQGGSILFHGKNLLALPEKEMRTIRGNQIALVPQDPMTSLNPVLSVGEQIMEALVLHQKLSRKEARAKAIELLRAVGIPAAETRIDDYPHHFSGGMRQRAIIAMALSCAPEILIADEPTTALDVTIQAQILELLQEIRKTREASIILITHDLGVVAEMCDKVAVMYAGKVVEMAPVGEIFKSPKHPYTVGLLHSIPRLGAKKARLQPIEGAPPRMSQLPTGCAFAPRCGQAHPKCKETPLLETIAPDHMVRCWLGEAK
ncbi:MAG: ABC transporter ATP-binding protein [Bacteroidota bacterium]